MRYPKSAPPLLEKISSPVPIVSDAIIAPGPKTFSQSNVRPGNSTEQLLSDTAVAGVSFIFYILFGAAQESFVKENRFIPMLRDKTNGFVEPFEMVGNVVGIKRPKVLFVSEDIHYLGLVRVPG